MRLYCLPLFFLSVLNASEKRTESRNKRKMKLIDNQHKKAVIKNKVKIQIKNDRFTAW